MAIAIFRGQHLILNPINYLKYLFEACFNRLYGSDPTMLKYTLIITYYPSFSISYSIISRCLKLTTFWEKEGLAMEQVADFSIWLNGKMRLLNSLPGNPLKIS